MMTIERFTFLPSNSFSQRPKDGGTSQMKGGGDGNDEIWHSYTLPNEE